MLQTHPQNQPPFQIQTNKIESIVLTIANKIADTTKVLQEVEYAIRLEKYHQEKLCPYSLSYGFAGTACFFSSLDTLYPSQGWDIAAHEHLSLAVNDYMTNGTSSLSLFNGFTGLCYAIALCAKANDSYQYLKKKTDDFFEKEINNYLYQLEVRLSTSVPKVHANDYNLANGLSGILAFLLLRKEDETFYLLIPRVTSLLSSMVLLQQEVTYKGNTLRVPLWFSSTYLQLNEEDAYTYPNGSYIHSLPFGSMGLLSALSLAALEGFHSPEIKKAINELATHQLAFFKKLHNKKSFPPQITLEQSLGEIITHTALERNTWCHGIPPLSHSLFLASKALDNKDLKSISLHLLKGMLNTDMKEWNLLATSYSYGRAGLLNILDSMGKETDDAALMKSRDLLASDLCRFFHSDHPFGFQSVSFKKQGDYYWVNSPTLLDGAAGIALSLQSLLTPLPLKWNRAFLIQ